MRDDEGEDPASSAVVLREHQTHHGVADERPEPLVQVVRAPQQRARGEDERRPPAQVTQAFHEVRDGDDLLIGTPFPWAANLVDGGRAEVYLLGRRTPVAVRRFADETGAVAVITEMCRQLPTFAAFMKVKRDPDGTPDPVAVHEAWAAGVKAFRLTPAD